MLVTLLACALLVVSTTLIHYEVLRLLSARLPALGIPARSKLVVVVLAIVYQECCAYQLRRFKAGTERHSHGWFRWFNEIPVLLLLAAVILVVVKPF